MPALSMKVAESGRTLLVLGQSAVTASYAAGPTPAVPGGKWDYNVVIAESAAAARAFATASKSGDDATMGDLLGFPPCCIDFFVKFWVGERWLDTTWPMSNRTNGLAGGSSNFGRSLEFTGVLPQNNILLRWLGVRLVPHLPCSHSCIGTTAFGEQFGKILMATHPVEYGWMLSLLGARLQWSANKGIAEIATPILKISTKTDALTSKVVVRLNGGDLEGQARGVMFPWKITSITPSITPMPLTFHKAESETLYSYNGFASLNGMTLSHAVIKDFYAKHYAEKTSLLVLRRGNSLLAAALSPLAHGVEADPARATDAEKRLPIVYPDTIISFMRLLEKSYDVALLSAERLAEMNELDRAYALRWLERHIEHVVLYTYSDGHLETICQNLGLQYEHLESRDSVQVARLVQ